MVESRENQGVRPRPDWSQVSVSPHGFGSEKNLFKACDFELRPLFTGQLFIVGEGLRPSRLRAVADVRADMPGRRWLPALISGMVRPIPAGHQPMKTQNQPAARVRIGPPG